MTCTVMRQLYAAGEYRLMDIEIVIKRLYESEINCSISSFWDNGWDAKLGDQMNGFVAEGNFGTLDEAADFLDREARKHFAKSLYAVGRFRYQNRHESN